MTDWDCVAVVVTCGEFDYAVEHDSSKECQAFCDGYGDAVNQFAGDGFATPLSWYEINERDNCAKWRDETLAKYGWSPNNG